MYIYIYIYTYIYIYIHTHIHVSMWNISQVAQKEYVAAETAYSSIVSRVEQRLLYITMTVMKEDSESVMITNGRLKHSQKENWFIRREAVRMLVPIAEAGDARALTMVRIHTYIHTYIHTHTYIRIYPPTHIYIYIYIYIDICVSMYVDTSSIRAFNRGWAR